MALQIRYGTDTQFESGKENIASGEMGVTTDTERMVVGVDGGEFMEILNIESLAPAYDTSYTYSTGDVVSRGGKLYELVGGSATGAWNSSLWSETSLGEIMEKIKLGKHTATLTGDIVTFDSDFNRELPFKKVSASIVAQQDGTPWIGTEHNSVPYNFRAVKDANATRYGNTEYGNVVGGTVAWHQLATVLNNSTIVIHGVTITYVDNSTVTISGESDARVSQRICSDIPVVKDHIYLISGMEQNSQSVGLIFNAYNGSSYVTTYSGTDIGNGCIIKSTNSNVNSCRIEVVIPNGTALSKTYTIKPQFFDLTQMFGTTIADYIYSLEQATAGAGVAWFKKLFPKPYYAYNAGELISVKTTAHETIGFNQWDEETRNGYYDNNGAYHSNANYIANKNSIKVLPSTAYYFAISPAPSSQVGRDIFFYDSAMNFISKVSKYANDSFTTPANACYANFNLGAAYGASYKNNICINLSDANLNGQYKPYSKHTYALDSDLEIRGIPKLDASNNLYYDGDIYPTSGNVTRKYGIVDLGSLDWNIPNGCSHTFVYLSLNKKYPSDNMVCSKYVVSGYRATDGNMSSWEQSYDKILLTSTGSERIVIVDASYSDATTFKTAMSGVYLVYELATPTTETADPYTSAQAIDEYGTEAFVDGRTVEIPVGHDSYFGDVFPISGWTGANIYVSPTADEEDATIYEVSWQTEAGTVYGGTIDVTTGVLTVTHAEVDLGEATWYHGSTWASRTYRTTISGIKTIATTTEIPHIICSNYPYGTSATSQSTLLTGIQNGTFCRVTNSENIYIRDDNYETYTDFASAMDGVQLGYELATPQVVQLTAQQVKMLIGENNVWSDVDEVEVIYYTKESSNENFIE